MVSDWMYRCPACGFCNETWAVCHKHMRRCCPHLLVNSRSGKNRKAREFRVPNSHAMAEKLAQQEQKRLKASRARAEDKRRSEAVAEIKASMPYPCSYGCGEGYDTKERCERHETVCARGVALRCRRRNQAADQHAPPSAAGGDAANATGESSAPNATGIGHDATCISRQTDHSTVIPPESKSSVKAMKRKEYRARRTDARAEARASLPFMCPAHGCDERYETRERFERHLKVCARAIAHHRRKDESRQLRPAFVGGGGTICNAAWGEPNTTVDEAFEFAPPCSNSQDDEPTSLMTGNEHDVNRFSMEKLSNGQVLTPSSQPGQNNENTIARSPYPQLPEQFGSYNCLLCSRGYTNWVDCVAHMVGCCNEVYENGKLWGGVEAVRIRCGVEEPSSKKCTNCGSFKAKQDFESTEWKEIGKEARIRQCKICMGRGNQFG